MRDGQLEERETERAGGARRSVRESLRARLVTQETVLYVGTAVLCVLLAARVLGVSPSDLRVPFAYSSDAVFGQAVTKGMIEHGWAYSNSSVGAPMGQLLLDYPNTDGAHVLLIKLISLVLRDAVMANNMYFLLGFALSGVTSLFVMRRFGVSRPAAFVASLAFVLLPFHFMRGISHLALAAYWSIPLTALLGLWAASGTPPFLKDGKLVWRERRSVAAIAVAFVVGCSGIYYAFFACIFLGAIAVYAWSKRRGVLFAMPALLLVCVIVSAVLLSVAPSVVYHRLQGSNPEAIIRLPLESELYALKITQLVLPVGGHRSPILAEWKQRYNQSISGVSPLNENETATLGTLGVIGFLALLAWTAFRIRPSRKGPASEVMEPLGAMNLTALLVGVLGGFGSLFAFFVSPEIRAYNRVSVYIAFFSLFALALLLDRFAFNRPWAQLPFATAALVAVLVIVAVLDQTTPSMAIDFGGLSAAYENDDAFVAAVEASVPPGSMIFQLPYVPFPESPPVGGMPDYEHFKAYIHSKTLRWSYGAMRGRESDIWQRQVSSLPAAEFLAQIEARGFAGVWVDRRGGGANEPGMQAALGVPPIQSADGQLAFYRIP
ncbi:MAG: hypothetical protein Q8K99_11885 [Actinomycetota bacterium]|nr:hypothetical protein [Actinomycetota bacterium]